MPEYKLIQKWTDILDKVLAQKYNKKNMDELIKLQANLQYIKGFNALDTFKILLNNSIIKLYLENGEAYKAYKQIEKVGTEHVVEPIKKNIFDKSVRSEKYKKYFYKNIKNLMGEAAIDFPEVSILETEKKDGIFIMKEDDFYETAENREIAEYYVNCRDDLFSDFCINTEKNPKLIYSVFEEVIKINRKLYIVGDIDVFCLILSFRSFGNSVQNLIFFENMDEFKSYFMDSEEYLPRNVLPCSGKDEFEKVIQEIHEYRLKNKAQRPPILTIGIPTYNRGKFAYENVINILKTKFDYEIELILSDNASDYQMDYYNKISEIEDARLTYTKNEENLGWIGNVLNILELANGEYVLFTADNDMIITKNISYFLALFIEKTYAVINTPINALGGKKTVTDDIFKSIGKDINSRIENFLFYFTVLSGTILNKRLLYETDALDFMKNNPYNQAARTYPHLVLELFLLKYDWCYTSLQIMDDFSGDHHEKKEDIIYSDNDEFDYVDQSKRDEFLSIKGFEVGKEKKSQIFNFYTICGRVYQYYDYYKILRYMYLEKEYISLDNFLSMYRVLIGRTIDLMRCTLVGRYTESDISSEELLALFKKGVSFVTGENSLLRADVDLPGYNKIDFDVIDESAGRSLEENLNNINEYFAIKGRI